ncbi:MAG: RDD family protein [Ardenticatenales bacterium]|nr:RDD family protein [Ardenticatenales bacterium]
MDDLRFETPEQIEINYDIARLGSRFIAALWDTLAIALLQFMLFFAGALILAILEQQIGIFASNWGVALLILVSFLLFWGYYVIFELIWNGQTPGKRLAGIRTVRQDGYPIGFSESAIRNIVRIVDLLPGIYGFGVLVMFIDKRSRRLGDFAAKTIVVHERPAVQLQSIRNTAVEDDRFLEPRLPNLRELNFDEVESARRFLQRYRSLSNADTLASQLASRFRTRLLLDESSASFPNDLLLLQQVVAQHGRE